MADEYIRREDAFDAVEARIAELMTHPEFRRKHLDIDLSGIIRNISAIEPADVVQVVHGHWIDVGSLSCRCDQCGCKNNKETRFCPYCGAKMDKE